MDKQLLIDELVRDEGIRLRAYADSLGILTIGIGRNIQERGITKAEAYVLCHNDIEDVEAHLDTTLPWWRKLDEVRQRVLANMAFNLGITRLLNFKHMLEALEKGWYSTAAAEMAHSTWHTQVGPRAERLEEAMRSGVMP